ncbi:MAG: nucleoside hydrolase [Acidimicrobiales bacterium]
MTSTPKIILDCDPGHDDAMAILVAATYGDLIGITTVSGNAPLDMTTRNALLVCQIAGLDVPVHAGAARPLVIEARHARQVHGATGLDGPDLPGLNRQVHSTDAVRFIIDTVRSTDDVWLVPIGPLTNIALALREAPDIAQRIAGISLMGGSAGPGNVTATAEFNIWADPHAARVVLSAGIAVVKMAGLNLTSQYTVDRGTVRDLASQGTETSTFASQVIEAYVDAGQRIRGVAEANLHDPCAVLALTHPELFTSTHNHVDVSTEGITEGMTVVDERGWGGAPPNVEVLRTIDRDEGIDVFVAAVRRFQ